MKKMQPDDDRALQVLKESPSATRYLLLGFALGMATNALFKGQKVSSSETTVVLPIKREKGKRLRHSAYRIGVVGTVLTAILVVMAFFNRPHHDGSEWFVHVAVFFIDTVAAFLGAAEAAYQTGPSKNWFRPIETEDVIVVCTFLIGFSAALYHFLPLL